MRLTALIVMAVAVVGCVWPSDEIPNEIGEYYESWNYVVQHSYPSERRAIWKNQSRDTCGARTEAENDILRKMAYVQSCSLPELRGMPVIHGSGVPVQTELLVPQTLIRASPSELLIEVGVADYPPRYYRSLNATADPSTDFHANPLVTTASYLDSWQLINDRWVLHRQLAVMVDGE